MPCGFMRVSCGHAIGFSQMRVRRETKKQRAIVGEETTFRSALKLHVARCGTPRRLKKLNSMVQKVYIYKKN